MSELIDRIPGQESVLARLRGVTNSTQQIKARQRITGRSGQLGYAVESAAAWDYVETLPYAAGPGYLGATYRVLFTSDGSQKFPIVVPATDLRFNGTADGNKPISSPDGSFWTYTDGSCDVTINGYEVQMHEYYGSENQHAWEFIVLYRGTVTLRFKLRGQASCNGTFSITRTS